MYAVIDVGSFQFKVAEGDIIDAPSIDIEPGEKLDIDKVLLIANGDDVKIGTPYLAGAKVSFEVVRHLRDDKDISFFFRKRKDVRKTIGHRQDLTALKVAKISA
ncbi:MAG: 50S ribosomal protein L21 [Candidatus Omnitrophica bacterium]|nr:50S ribosomal protein L21 [Candidatus Omnitrophota bacterium]